MNRRLKSAALLTVVVLMGGLSCRTMQKATGTQEAFLSAAPDKVVEAAKDAIKGLELTIVSSSASKVDGQITARTAQDKAITVKVLREGDERSRMTVKIGTLGDRAIGEAIISETKKRLE